jgi:hypothetical protein
MENPSLGEILADVQRSTAKNRSNVSSMKIDNPVVANDANSAHMRHQITLLQPKAPDSLSEILNTASIPSTVMNMYLADARIQEAPERQLSHFKDDGTIPTYAQREAAYEEFILDSEILTPMIYLNNPNLIKHKTMLMDNHSYLLPRNVPKADMGENERDMHQMKSVQEVRSQFKEIPMTMQKKYAGYDPRSWFTKR